MELVDFVLSLLAHAVSSSALRRYDNYWISAETLVAILHAHFKINASAIITVGHLISALSQRNLNRLIRTLSAALHKTDDFSPNPSNLYRVQQIHEGGKISWIFNLYFKENLNYERPLKQTRRSARAEARAEQLVTGSNSAARLPLQEPETSLREFNEQVLNNNAAVEELLIDVDQDELPPTIRSLEKKIVVISKSD